MSRPHPAATSAPPSHRGCPTSGPQSDVHRSGMATPRTRRQPPRTERHGARNRDGHLQSSPPSGQARHRRTPAKANPPASDRRATGHRRLSSEPEQTAYGPAVSSLKSVAPITRDVEEEAMRPGRVVGVGDGDGDCAATASSTDVHVRWTFRLGPGPLSVWSWPERRDPPLDQLAPVRRPGPASTVATCR